MKCPISLEKPNIPVLTDNGIRYDFYHLASHILTSGPQDPITRSPINSLILIRDEEICEENIDIEETSKVFMRLVNAHPYLKVRGVGELSFLQAQIAPVNNFLQSLKINKFEVEITLFHLAAHLGNLECMKTLINANILSINQGFKDNITALHLACAAIRPDIVKWLLSFKEIEVNCAQHSNGITPLHIATSKCNATLVGLLAQHPNINIKAPRKDGVTSFEYAIHNHQLKILTILLLCSTFPSECILYADQQNDIEFINKSLEYYLHEMLHRPEAMAAFLAARADVKAILYKHQDKLWEGIIHPSKHLNLALKFPDFIDENNFNKQAYYKFIENQLENEKKGIFPSHPLFSIFHINEIDSKLDFFKTPHAIEDQINRTNETKPEFKHSHSMSCLSN